MYEVRSAEYIRIYESIVIEFFIRFEIQRVCTDVPRFDIENINFILSMVIRPSNQTCSFMVKPLYCARPDQYKITVDM